MRERSSARHPSWRVVANVRWAKGAVGRRSPPWPPAELQRLRERDAARELRPSAVIFLSLGVPVVSRSGSADASRIGKTVYHIDIIILFLVTPTGFEPVTPRLGIWWSAQQKHFKPRSKRGLDLSLLRHAISGSRAVSLPTRRSRVASPSGSEFGPTPLPAGKNHQRPI